MNDTLHTVEQLGWRLAVLDGCKDSLEFYGTRLRNIADYNVLHANKYLISQRDFQLFSYLAGKLVGPIAKEVKNILDELQEQSGGQDDVIFPIYHQGGITRHVQVAADLIIREGNDVNLCY